MSHAEERLRKTDKDGQILPGECPLSKVKDDLEM